MQCMCMITNIYYRWWLLDWPQTSIQRGQFHKADILAGATLDEMNIAALSDPNYQYATATYEGLEGWISNLTAREGIDVAAGNAITSYYLNPNQTYSVIVPRNKTDTVGTSKGAAAGIVEISSGILFQCPIRRNLRYQSDAGNKAYGYAWGLVSPLGTYMCVCMFMLSLHIHFVNSQ
jgi:hypothetical protein